MTSYPDLVAAATVGIAQRPLTITDLAAPATSHVEVLDSDPAGALLDAAALLDGARRAGGLTLAQVDLPPVAVADPLPELSDSAGMIIGGVLETGPAELLADLLAVAARAGRRAPAPLLPALLAAAAARPALRPAVASVLGRRGRWLAAQQPEWLPVVDAGQVPASEDAWQTGRLVERQAWLADLRRRDPEAAQALLAEGWARETGDDRAALLGVLAVGLTSADEPFLEAALDDRKAEVRRAAATLLARLPESAYVARARARAATAVRLERRALRRRLAVTLPPEPDAAERRDGLDARPPDKRIGARAWLLTQIVAAAPLDAWPGLLGAPPGELVGLPVADDFAVEVHAGWRTAAVRQRNAEWATALLVAAADAPPPRPGWPSDEALAAVLPADQRQARAAALLRDERTDLAARAAAVEGCPPPWNRQLAVAVLAFVTRATRADPSAQVLQALRAVLAAATRGLPIDPSLDAAGELRRLADDARATLAASGALRRAADVLDLRRRFLEELP